MTRSFSITPTPDEIYRFRSVDALLGPNKELYRQTIYLARPDELNDPAEDNVNVVWHGDDIIWDNLIKFYLRSLVASSIRGYVFLPGHHLHNDRRFDQLVETSATQLRDSKSSEIRQLLDDLKRNSPVSHYDMMSTLLKLTSRYFPSSFFPSNNTHPIENFPKLFLKKMGKILLSEWGIASFTKDFTNPYLWSSYAEDHSGVCVVFDRKALLDSLVDSFPGAKVELEDVSYERAKPEIEFFSNVPRMTAHEYENLFIDAAGRLSPLSPLSHENEDSLREALSRRIQLCRKNILTKHRHWEAEKEVRLFCLFDLGRDVNADSAEYTLQYPIDALKGIIFGSRIDQKDRQSILEVILSKHYVAPMAGFSFQVAYPQPDGEMYRTYYEPYLGWRESYSYPKPRR